MSVWVAALVTVAAITATYLLCVRPMLGERAGCGAPADTSQSDADLSRRIAELREELRILRAEEALDAGRATGGGEPPSTTAL